MCKIYMELETWHGKEGVGGQFLQGWMVWPFGLSPPNLILQNIFALEWPAPDSYFALCVHGLQCIMVMYVQCIM